jgi:hypothetical protein
VAPAKATKRRETAEVSQILHVIGTLQGKQLVENDVAHSLNRFFKQLGDPILANNGVINQYLATACSPSSGSTAHATNAVRVSLWTLAAARHLNRYLPPKLAGSRLNQKFHSAHEPANALRFRLNNHTLSRTFGNFGIFEIRASGCCRKR